MTERGLHRETELVRLGRPPAEPGRPINTPITASATYHAGGERDYARSGSDSIQALEAAIGDLEGGRTVAFSAGVAATAAVLSMLPAGAVVVIPASFYNYHATILADHEKLGRLTIRRVDTGDAEAVERAVGGAALLWLEIPSNPTIRVADLPRLAELAHRAGALVGVDATLATPLGLRPLELGADISMHSATKAISGHSDVLLGLLTAAPGLGAELLGRRSMSGAVPGNLECFLALRGLRTLALRRERSQASAMVLAERLEADPRVSAVHYAGLAGHPDHEVAARVLDGVGSLLSFEVLGGLDEAAAFCRRLATIVHATSLGGVESLIEDRGRYPGEVAQGTPGGLLRLSVGIEHVEDLWADLDQAFAT